MHKKWEEECENGGYHPILFATRRRFYDYIQERNNKNGNERDNEA